MNLAEAGPVQLDPIPALDHEVVDLTRTVGRLTEHDVQLLTGAAACTVVDDLRVAECVERTLPGERQDLPQRHAEGPDITLRRELVLPTDMPPATMLTT